MVSYIFKRIMLLIPLLLITSFISYSIIYLSPGKPAELILRIELQGIPSKEQIDTFEKENGLDKPLFVQYGSWMQKAFRGDLGKSLKSNEPVWDVYKNKFIASAKLFLCGQLIAIIIAIPFGILSAIKSNSFTDNLIRIISLTGISLPSFWLGMLLVYIFAVKLQVLPALGYEGAKNIILPAFTLGITGSMGLMRLTRTSILEVLRLNYVRTARAKGLRERVVITKHVLRNALIPVVTAIGMHFNHMIGGMVIIEMLFAWPGLGRLLVEAANTRDIPVIQGFVLISAILFVVINLIIDLLYMVLDPRISYKARGG